jgi:hypothetical protein
MKKVILILSVLLAFQWSNAQTSPANEVAEKIAQKMKDTLALTDAQKGQIFDVNIQLHNQKMLARQHQLVADSLRRQVQRIENTRDSLYNLVLPQEKYLLYLQKKRNLVSNN